MPAWLLAKELLTNMTASNANFLLIWTLLKTSAREPLFQSTTKRLMARLCRVNSEIEVRCALSSMIDWRQQSNLTFLEATRRWLENRREHWHTFGTVENPWLWREIKWHSHVPTDLLFFRSHAWSLSVGHWLRQRRARKEKWKVTSLTIYRCERTRTSTRSVDAVTPDEVDCSTGDGRPPFVSVFFTKNTTSRQAPLQFLCQFVRIEQQRWKESTMPASQTVHPRRHSTEISISISCWVAL